jgi:hypothetical protein
METMTFQKIYIKEKKWKQIAPTPKETGKTGESETEQEHQHHIDILSHLPRARFIGFWGLGGAGH